VKPLHLSELDAAVAHWARSEGQADYRITMTKRGNAAAIVVSAGKATLLSAGPEPEIAAQGLVERIGLLLQRDEDLAPVLAASVDVARAGREIGR